MANNKQDNRGLRETHVDERMAENYFDEVNPYDIEKLPKIEGMVLEWQRISYMGENDTKNIMKANTRGWRPVLAETLKQSALESGFEMSYLPTTKFGEQSGVVGTFDLILMAIPTKIHEAYNASIKKRVELQQASQDTIFNNSLNVNIPSSFVSPMKRGDIPLIDD
jgi:hypothetical protein